MGQQFFSQSTVIDTQEQVWVGYFNQTRFTNKSGMWVDLHLRFTGNFTDHLYLAIALPVIPITFPIR
jgi:hypothetical protein